jgi:hypothetical protein
LAFIALRFNFIEVAPSLHPYVVDITLREKLVATFNVSLSSPLALEKGIGKHEAKPLQAFQAFSEHIKKIQASNTRKLTVTLHFS